MRIPSLKWMALFCAFSAIPVSANVSTNTKVKDCWMYMVTNKPDKPGTPPKMAYRNEDQYRKRLHSDTQKSLCMDEYKNGGCDEMLKHCSANQQTPAGMVGLVGAWVSWGTSREDCPRLCDGFSNVSPKSFAP